MKLPTLHRRRTRQQNGSLLIIVLWIAFGLVTVALYFGHSMMFEFRAAEQSAAGVAADQAIEGAQRYLSFALTNLTVPGRPPTAPLFKSEAVPVGDATFWLIGRTNVDDLVSATPIFGLVSEASKLNLNTATLEMLQALPRMTPELAAAIVDWRDTDDVATNGGAESETYARVTALAPPSRVPAIRGGVSGATTRVNAAYASKNGPFESVEELRLIAGASPEILWGEDRNFNGVPDANEASGQTTRPMASALGQPPFGLLEYVTVYSREPNLRTNGEARINVNGTDRQALTARLQELFGQQRAQAIAQRLPPPGTAPLSSVLEVYQRSGMTEQEFVQVEGDLSVTNTAFQDGLVDVNTASAAVLACIPGIGLEKAQQLVALRRTRTDTVPSLAWVTQVLEQTNILQAGRYLTGRSYQFSADVVAVGQYDRGYRRTCFVFDTSEGVPKVLYRRDRARLGWALGTLRRSSDGRGKGIGS